MLVDSMLSADMSGVSSHGIKMLIPYVRKLEKGEFSLEDITIEKQTPGFTLVNANNAIGAISADHCVDIAIEQAKTNGVHIVWAKNCNTLGPAFYYVEKIANNNMIGFTCCNSPSTMPVFNGLEPMLGTNPFAFSCPSASKGNILIDMATSVVAKSKFEMCRIAGTKLEPGWALDKDGNPTVDPVDAINGLVLPMAGFKGYAIAMMIDIMSGVLSGSAYLSNVNKFYSQNGMGMNVGQMFMAISPELIFGEGFLAEMDQYLDAVRSSKAVEGKMIAVPGDDRQTKKEAAIESKKIAISDEIAVELEKLFSKK